MSEWSDNYDELATIDDGSCLRLGCTNDIADNYDMLATLDDGSCVITGCIDSTAFNFDPNSNTLDDSCIPVILGCIDQAAFNFDSNSNTDDGSCIPVILGCMDETAFNYSSEANTHDGSCASVIYGCTDDGASNFNPNANTENGTCLPYLHLPLGWSMFGYTCIYSIDAMMGFADISDKIEIVKDEWGLSYLLVLGFNAMGSLIFSEGYQIKMTEEVSNFKFCNIYDGWCISDLDNDGICDVDEVIGCMDSLSCNYVAIAEFDDGSCNYGLCVDDCGVPNGDNTTCADECGIPNGDNSSCADEWRS